MCMTLFLNKFVPQNILILRLFTIEIYFLSEDIHAWMAYAWMACKDKPCENLTFPKKVLSDKICFLMEL